MFPDRILEIKVTLRHLDPPVWRRIRLSSAITFAQLQDTLQVTMGWKDKHLHEFEANTVRYGVSDGMRPEVADERRVRLGEFLKSPGDSFGYWYDFGDDWWHDVVFEREVRADPGVKYPQVVAGERACPPEDCGGPHYFPEFLEALRNPKHPRHKELKKWVGGGFDPEAFDVHECNMALHVVAGRRSRILPIRR